MFYTNFIDFYRSKFEILSLAYIMWICLYMLHCNIKGKHAKLNHFDLGPGQLDSAWAQVWPITAKLSNTAANGRIGFLTDSWHLAYTNGKPINMVCKVQNFLPHWWKSNCTRLVQTKTTSWKHGMAAPAAQPLMTQGTAGEQTTGNQKEGANTTKMTTRSPTNISKAIQYERQLSKIINDVEMVLLTSNGNDDSATPFVYLLFEIMRTRGIKLEDANPKVVHRAISDHKMHKLVKVKQRSNKESGVITMHYKCGTY